MARSSKKQTKLNDIRIADAFELRWIEPRREKGWSDFLPKLWFKSASKKGVLHYMLSPTGELIEAKCDLIIDRKSVTLNYMGSNARFNARKDVIDGITKIEFDSDHRKKIAHVLMRTSANKKFRRANVEIDPVDNDPDIEEGSLRTRAHQYRERSIKLRNRKIRAVRKARGELCCEACNFSFEKQYGNKIGDFCEVHHRKGFAASGVATPKLKDLAVLCANCHRMIHRTSLTVEQFARNHVRKRFSAF